MIQIHQAIYGDKNGGYALLNSSFSKTNTPEKLGNSTDLTDRPPDTVLKKPAISGFLRVGFFILVKSFPDLSAGRRGRLFSHALIMKEKDYLKLKDITVLIPYFLGHIDKEIALKPIGIQPNTINPQFKKHQPSQLPCAVNALIKHHDFDNTIAWLGEEDYFEWLSRIWHLIPDALKLKLRIGVAFDPQKIKMELLNLVFVPQELRINWVNTNFKLIESNCVELIESQGAHLLAGDDLQAKDLQNLLNDFEFTIEEFDDLNVMETMLAVYQSFVKSDFNELMNFVHLVSYFSPNSKFASVKKAELIETIIKRINNSSPNEMLVLANPNWSGFANAETHLSKALESRLNTHLMNQKLDSSMTTLLMAAFNAKDSGWWNQAIMKSLNYSLSNWKKKSSTTIWNWFITEPALIEHLEPLLPFEAGEDLVLSLPKKLKKSIAKILFELAQRKNWLYLHGVLGLTLYDAEIALKHQLNIDTQEDHSKVIKLIAKEISDDKFIELSISRDDERLYSLSVERYNDNPLLLDAMDIAHEGWQRLWFKITELQKVDMWNGISNPSQVLFSIMDLLREGHEFDTQLLLKISTSSVNDLKKYPFRKEVWGFLPKSVKDNFLHATSISILQAIMEGKIVLKDLEKTLKDHIESRAFIYQLLENKSLTLSSKIDLFESISSFGQDEAIYLIEKNRFTNIEATLLGKLVNNKDWKRVAERCYSQLIRRKDLLPALYQCSDRLGFWSKLGFSMISNSSTSISKKECWNALEEKATKLFPSGPDHNGIWEQAGGDNADLIHSATGKKRWHEAIRLIKNGGNPDVKSLIKEMLLEYPRDSELKMLKTNL